MTSILMKTHISEGAVLQSNVGLHPLVPIFEDVLGPMSKREEVWAALRELKVQEGCLWHSRPKSLMNIFSDKE